MFYAWELSIDQKYCNQLYRSSEKNPALRSLHKQTNWGSITHLPAAPNFTGWMSKVTARTNNCIDLGLLIRRWNLTAKSHYTVVHGQQHLLKKVKIHKTKYSAKRGSKPHTPHPKAPCYCIKSDGVTGRQQPPFRTKWLPEAKANSSKLTN